MNQQPQYDLPTIYQIKIAGHLNPAWSEWLEGLTLTHEPDGSTALTGDLTDQADLYGLLIKLRDLGLTLLSVQRLSKTK